MPSLVASNLKVTELCVRNTFDLLILLQECRCLAAEK